MPTLPEITYSAFLNDPSRRDVYLFDVVVKDSGGTSHTLRWATKAYRSLPSDTPASELWEERVAEGGINFESAAFDPHSPQYGVLPTPAPPSLVVHQIDGDLDATMDYRWAGATITVRHGGWTSRGQVPLASFGVIATLEVDGWPAFEMERVTFRLRSYDSRFDDPVERRVLAGLHWCLEGDGTNDEVSFNPFNPGVRFRAKLDGVSSSNGGVATTLTRPEGIVAGDLMVAFIASHNDGGSPYQNWEITSAPSGWSLIDSAVVTSGGVAAVRLYAYRKTAGASEPSTYTWGGTGEAPNRVWSVSVWYGQNGATPIADSGNGSGTSATPTAPDVTSAQPNEILLAAFASPRASDAADPAGMTRVTNRAKNVEGGNRASLKVCSELVPSAGATGTRSITQSASSGWAALSVIIGNRVSGGQPTKLDLRDAVTAHFAFVPLAIGGKDQHLVGWETTPFRAFIDVDGRLNWSWEKSSVTVTKTTSYVFSSERRYHVDVIHTDTFVRFRIYDWVYDSLTEETFTGTGFTGRDGPGASDQFTMLYNENGGVPEGYYNGQLWTWRLWSGAKDTDFLDDQRNRPLTDDERLDSTLVHYVEFVERTDDLLGDLALDPADGVIAGATWRPTLTGEQEQVGQPVPCVFGGPVFGWPGVMVESDVDGAFFMVHPVKVEDIVEVQEGGAPREISVEYTSYRGFLANLPEVGTYTTYRGDLGSFYRCRTVPVLPSTCTVKGDAWDGTFVETAGDIVERVVTTRGEEPIAGLVDAPSLAALNAAAPHPIDGGVGAGESIRDFSRRILGTVGAVLHQKRDGDFHFEQWAGATGSASQVYSRKQYVRGSLRVLAPELPVRKVAVKYRRNWTPLTRDQVSADLTDEDDAQLIRFLLTPWRSMTFRRWQVANRYPRARDMEVEGYFASHWYGWQHAQAEANRLLNLYGTPPQYLEVTLVRTGTPLELFDVVGFWVRDLDGHNQLRDRLGTAGAVTATLWVVTHVRDDRMRGTETVRLWRQDSTTTA